MEKVGKLQLTPSIAQPAGAVGFGREITTKIVCIAKGRATNSLCATIAPTANVGGRARMNTIPLRGKANGMTAGPVPRY